MTIKSISTSKDIQIVTEQDNVHQIEILTYLGTTVFKDNIFPKNKIINIKGLNPGKYIISLSNQESLIKKNIKIK